MHEVIWRLKLRPRWKAMPYDETAADFTPATPRGLRPGQLVRVRSKQEIAKTLDADGKTRGLWFDREMLVHCGKTYRVKAKVERFIEETTGRLVQLSSDCYILEGVMCSGERSTGRHLCPRAIYPWWRECWLVPVEEAEAGRRRRMRADVRSSA
jgi:hypothetical protein